MILKVEAIVIGKRRSLEQDLSITLLTRQLGKIYVRAKNAQKITSSRLGSLQLGNSIIANLQESHQTYWLWQSTSTYSFLGKAKTLTQANLLFYTLEMISKLLPEKSEQEEIYLETKEAIQAIEKQQVGKLIRHQINIIHHLGYGIPEIISTKLKQEDFRSASTLLRHHIENILGKPLQSNKLFS